MKKPPPPRKTGISYTMYPQCTASVHFKTKNVQHWYIMSLMGLPRQGSEKQQEEWWVYCFDWFITIDLFLGCNWAWQPWSVLKTKFGVHSPNMLPIQTREWSNECLTWLWIQRSIVCLQLKNWQTDRQVAVSFCDPEIRRWWRPS